MIVQSPTWIAPPLIFNPKVLVVSLSFSSHLILNLPLSLALVPVSFSNKLDNLDTSVTIIPFSSGKVRVF